MTEPPCESRQGAKITPCCVPNFRAIVLRKKIGIAAAPIAADRSYPN